MAGRGGRGAGVLRRRRRSAAAHGWRRAAVAALGYCGGAAVSRVGAAARGAGTARRTGRASRSHRARAWRRASSLPAALAICARACAGRRAAPRLGTRHPRNPRAARNRSRRCVRSSSASGLKPLASLVTALRSADKFGIACRAGVARARASVRGAAFRARGAAGARRAAQALGGAGAVPSRRARSSCWRFRWRDCWRVAVVGRWSTPLTIRSSSRRLMLACSLRAPADLRAGRCRARRSAWAGAPAGRRAAAAAVCAPRSPRSSFSSRKHQRGKIAGTPTAPAYCAAAMDAGVAPPHAGEAAQVFGGHGHLVGERDEHAIGGRRRVREAFADGAGDAFGPVAIHGDAGGAVLEQRREFAGIRAEHHGDGVAGELHGAADDGVHERASVDAHQLFGGAETRRAARGQHHDVDVARLGARASTGFSVGRGIRWRATETTQTPAIMAVLPAISAKAERGMTSSTTRIVMAASARMVTLARTRATPLWLRISESVFCGSRFMAGDITPVRPAAARRFGRNR